MGIESKYVNIPSMKLWQEYEKEWPSDVSGLLLNWEVFLGSAVMVQEW
jgi:hypothetical protein